MGNSDSKIELQGIAAAFAEQDLSQSNRLHEIVEQFLSLPKSTDDVFEILQPDAIRRMSQEQPGNLKLLIENAVSTMATVSRTKSSSEFPLAMNSVRFLTRVLPYLFEDDTSFQHEYFWKSNGTPLAVVLLRSIGDLFFVQGLTIHEQRVFEAKDSPDLFDSDLLWLAGVGGTTVAGHIDPALDANKVDILRLMLVCLSNPLFLDPDHLDGVQPDPWTSFVVSSGEFPFLAPLVCSLLNTSLGYNKPAWIKSGSHPSVDLATLCTQVLAVLLDVNMPSPVVNSDRIDTQNEDSNSESGNLHNFAREYLIKHLGDTQIGKEFVIQNVSRLLEMQYTSYNEKSGGSDVVYYQELLVVLWELLDGNKPFLSFVLKSGYVPSLVLSLSYIMLRSRSNASKTGLVHLCTFLLLLLSGERDFGVSLNVPVTAALPPLGNGTFNGINHADLLVLVFLKLYVDSNGALESLLNCFLTIIGNYSPYIMQFSMPAAVRLVHFFELLSSPKLLLTDKSAHQHVQSMLEIFNNVVQYQYHRNHHLVYAIVHRADLINQLVNLPTNQAAIDDIVNIGSQQPSSTTTEAGGESIVSDEVGFRATVDWVNSWKRTLSLNTTVRMVQYLEPRIAQVCQEQGSVKESEILHFIQNTTLVGLLPVPHPIIIRKYQPNQYTSAWFSTFLWGVVYVNNQKVPLWDGESIELFHVAISSEE